MFGDIGKFIGGAFGGPIGATIGGFAGSLLETAEGRNYNEKLTAQEQAHQDEREDSVYQRKVIDAKAAGLHPLFAMGASGVAGPSTITGQSVSGSHAKDAVARSGNKALTELQIKNAEVDLRRNIIDEQLMQARLDAVTNQVMTRPGIVDLRRTNPGKKFIPPPAQMPPATIQAKDKSKYDGLVEVMPQPQFASDPADASRTPGYKPGWEKTKMFGDQILYMPASEEGWADAISSPFPFALAMIKNTYEGTAIWARAYLKANNDAQQAVRILFQEWKKTRKGAKTTPYTSLPPAKPGKMTWPLNRKYQ